MFKSKRKFIARNANKNTFVSAIISMIVSKIIARITSKIVITSRSINKKAIAG
jgi:hypothetical protein